MLWLRTDGTVWVNGGILLKQIQGPAMEPVLPVRNHQTRLWFQNYHLGQFGALLVSFLGPPKDPPDPRNCSNASLGMCPDLFHPCSTRLEPPDPIMAQKGHIWPFGPFWGPSGTPGWPSLTRETVPMHHRGCALTCSTPVPHCSTRLEPPDLVMAQKGSFWPF